MKFAGLDIGGAHTKFATTDGIARQISLPIWQKKEKLELLLREIEATLSGPHVIGVTMTAELADCFEGKRQGVRFIATAVSKSFPTQTPLFYQLDGNMCPADTAIEQWNSVAASNWHALAWYAFHDFHRDSGFLFDIGSTTCDIIPVGGGVPIVPNQSDFDRLSNGQLFYAGIGRTPVCSILDAVTLNGGTTTIAREFFATMSDVFLWLGQITPDPDSVDTADGQPATRANSGRRLARMLCLEFDPDSTGQVDAIAVQAKQKLVALLTNCLATVTSNHPCLPRIFRISGGGNWLAREVILQTFGENQGNSDVMICPLETNVTRHQTAPALAVAVRRQQIYHDHLADADGK